MQRSEKQRQASRENGKKSRGPTSPEGKDVSKFNGVTHGLCAVHPILPGEDPARFEAELQAWNDDWRPATHTRAVLVQRAAVATWRLNRAVKAETAWLGRRAELAGDAFDFERFNRADRAVSRAATDPAGALSLLEMDATGIDRVIDSCGELERALEAGPTGWDQPHYHQRLMLVTRHRLDEYPHNAGPIPRASARLLAANNAEFANNPCFDYGHCVVIFPLPEEERDAAVELLKRAVAEKVARLRQLRATMPDPAELRDRAVAAAYCDGSEEGKLRHRYEMAIDRSLRATIQQLIALEKSGADLPGDDTQHDDTKVDTTESPASAEPPEAEAPGSVGAPEPGSIPTRPEAPVRVQKAPNPAPARRRRRRSRR